MQVAALAGNCFECLSCGMVSTPTCLPSSRGTHCLAHKTIPTGDTGPKPHQHVCWLAISPSPVPTHLFHHTPCGRHHALHVKVRRQLHQQLCTAAALLGDVSQEGPDHHQQEGCTTDHLWDGTSASTNVRFQPCQCPDFKSQ